MIRTINEITYICSRIKGTLSETYWNLKKRYVFILYMRSLRNFNNGNKRWRNGFHAYAWGYYSHICFQRFSQGLHIETWNIVPRFLCKINKAFGD